MCLKIHENYKTKIVKISLLGTHPRLLYTNATGRVKSNRKIVTKINKLLNHLSYRKVSKPENTKWQALLRYGMNL